MPGECESCGCQLLAPKERKAEDMRPNVCANCGHRQGRPYRFNEDEEPSVSIEEFVADQEFNELLFERRWKK